MVAPNILLFWQLALLIIIRFHNRKRRVKECAGHTTDRQQLAAMKAQLRRTFSQVVLSQIIPKKIESVP